MNPTLPDPKTCLSRLADLSLRRADAPGEAGLLIASLPWPAARARTLGLGGRPTYLKPIGRWPGCANAFPRRLLLVADGANEAPDALTLGRAPRPPTKPPTADMVRFAMSPEPSFLWERHVLRIRWGGRSFGLALGLRTGGQVHWWEACRLVTIEDSPACRVIHMAGSIPRDLTDHALMLKHPGYGHPLLHKHHWLSGHVFARLHANGVCEVFARHVNSRFFDDGRDLADVVPVLGFQADAGTVLPPGLEGTWDGSRPQLEINDARLDLSEPALLATPEQPGRLDRHEEFLVWQPYLGVEVYGGVCPKELKNDPWLFRAEDRLFPRGMARTLRFSVSLSDRSPRTARYLAPYWWYGANAELGHEAFLPVSNAYDAELDRCRSWLRASVVRRGFEAGAVPRGAPLRPAPDHPPKRHEAGWEGEVPHAQFLLAYRSGDSDDYACALRSAYHFTDVAVDHAAKLVRMHGFPPVAFAQPMNRVLGTLAAYLETGDPYLLDTAEAVTESAYRLHQNSWPRLAVGRDACFVRGAVMLYRYFANDHFRRIAFEGALSVAQSQRENGSFGDQGGGAGIHQWGAYITKPWMAMLATAGVLDYLDLFPDEEPLRRCILRAGDWLMRIRWTRDGFTGWSYQHDFNGKPEFFDFHHNRWTTLPHAYPWHQENLGRVLAYCTLQTDDSAYLDAWAESFATHAAREGGGGDHTVSAAFQYLPRIQAALWRATLTCDGVAVRPFRFGDRTPPDGLVHGPAGALALHWDADGKVRLPDGTIAGEAQA